MTPSPFLLLLLPPNPPTTRRETCPTGFSLYVRAEEILRPRLCGTHTATRNDTMPTFRAALSFAPPSVQGCFPKGILADSFQFPTDFSIFFLPERDRIVIPDYSRPIPARLLTIFPVRTFYVFFLFFFFFFLEFSGKETKSKRSTMLVVSHVTRLMHSGNVFPGILNGERDTENVFLLRVFLTTLTRTARSCRSGG